MTLIIAVIALVLAMVALSRASAAERQLAEVRRQLELLKREALEREPGNAAPPASTVPRGGVVGRVPQAEMPDTAGPVPGTSWPGRPVISPDSQASETRPNPAPKVRGPSLWGPEFSRARISLFGGALVLGGLAFTLDALGAPAWTLLLAVFAFAGLLYINARRVPWPVSGALRGLGYGVAALGLGSLAARLPGSWGPDAVLLGLLALSAALLFDALRRREPLLGALAVGGAALTTWMLTDDLGRFSIVAAGLTLLLAAAAVYWHPEEKPASADTPDGSAQQASQTPALMLTLAIAGAVPLGWAVASASHLPFAAGLWPATQVMRGLMLGSVSIEQWALLPWLGYGLLALSLPLALLARRSGEPETPGLPLAVAWSILAPQTLFTAAAASALGVSADPLGLTLLLLLALVWVARRAWKRRRAAPSLLTETLSGSLIAAATSLCAALIISLLGERTTPLALAGLATTLLLLGIYGHSRFWLRVGAVWLAGLAIWGAAPVILDALYGVSLLVPAVLWNAALLGLAPAALGLIAAWRISRAAWLGHGMTPDAAIAPVLAALCSTLLGLGLLSAGAAVLWVWCVLAATVLLLPALRRRFASDLIALSALAPGLALGALLLPDGSATLTFLRVTATLLAGLALLANRTWSDRRSGRRATEVIALALLALGAERAAQTGWPALGWPGVLALLVLLTAPLRLTLSWRRSSVMLGLGLLALLGVCGLALLDQTIDLPVLGAVLLGAVWWLTRTVSGLAALSRLTSRLGGLPPDAAAGSPVVRPWWLSALGSLTLLTVGLRLSGEAYVSGTSWPLGLWLVAGSLLALAAGLYGCVQAQQRPTEARAVWSSGLGVILATGFKAALLDASLFGNPAAGAGAAVLATGLSLLAVAIKAPRPAALAQTQP